MDSFKEQIVRKIPTKNDKIQKIFIMIASVALAALCFIFPFGTQFSVIGIFLAAAALYSGHLFVTGYRQESLLGWIYKSTPGLTMRKEDRHRSDLCAPCILRCFLV